MSKKSDVSIFRVEGTSHLKEDFKNIGLKNRHRRVLFKHKFKFTQNLLNWSAVSKNGIWLSYNVSHYRRGDWGSEIRWFARLTVSGASLVAQMVKNLPAMQETWVQSLGQEDPLEKGIGTHSSFLAWRIQWTGSLVGCSPWGCRVQQDWVTVIQLVMWQSLD